MIFQVRSSPFFKCFSVVLLVLFDFPRFKAEILRFFFNLRFYLGELALYYAPVLFRLVFSVFYGDILTIKGWCITIMANQNEIDGSKAQLDFVVKFNLMDLASDDFQVLCPKCHRPYAFDEALKTKLNKLKNLILVLRDAESILGDCNVAVTVPAGEVKIPYALLLTRLNTMITLNIGDKKVDFHIWIEPTSANTFR